MWIITHRLVQEFKLDLTPLQFIDNQHLMQIVASQTVWARDDDHVKFSKSRPVTQIIQGGTGQRRSAVTIIQIHMRRRYSRKVGWGCNKLLARNQGSF